MQALVIDGAHGEGGGQILRTVLSLAALTGRTVRIENIRASRKKPGLAAQHLTAVRAAAAVCAARMKGAELGSRVLDFDPQTPPRPGNYVFDVAAAREGGSAGSALLVLQTVLVPLAFGGGESTVLVEGGTHNDKAPIFDYVDEVWRPAVAGMGMGIRLTLPRSGWFPVGKGRVKAWIQGGGADGRGQPFRPLVVEDRGRLQRVRGRALAANLPSHIPQRMADRARGLLTEEGIAADIVPQRLNAACPGAGLFLVAEYEDVRAGFSALGRRGKPAERVAEEAVAELLRHRRTGAALDWHLGDQLLLPAALAEGTSSFTVERISRHLTTNAWAIGQFGLGHIETAESPQMPARVIIQGAAFKPWA